MIATDVPGPWVVHNQHSTHWAIVNVETGRRKLIGPVCGPRSHSKVNYFDRAYQEATRRNEALANATGEQA